MEHDKRFAALSLTLKYDGLKLLCMIRLCPLPYSICNGAVSTFPTVQPLMYGLATAIICPKLLVPAFIGSRIRLLSEKGEEMSAGSKAVNIISIIVTVCVGVFTGYYIYNRWALSFQLLDRCMQQTRLVKNSITNDKFSPFIQNIGSCERTRGQGTRRNPAISPGRSCRPSTSPQIL